MAYANFDHGHYCSEKERNRRRNVRYIQNKESSGGDNEEIHILAISLEKNEGQLMNKGKSLK